MGIHYFVLKLTKEFEDSLEIRVELGSKRRRILNPVVTPVKVN